MYNPAFPVGSVAAGGVIATTSGFVVVGWTLLGASVLIAAALTVARLARGRR